MAFENENRRIETCCKQLIMGGVSEMRSLFEKHILLDYYDGPLTGLLQCGTCYQGYVYSIIDWDDARRSRIFSLAALPQGSFEAVVSLWSSNSHPPNWPTWTPVRHPEEPDRSERDIELEHLLSGAHEPELVFLTQSTFQVISTSRVPEQELRLAIQQSTDREFGLPTPMLDWFEYLGVAR